MKKTLIISISLCFSMRCLGQKTDKIPFEEIDVNEIGQMINGIDTMPLTCDTFYMVPYDDIDTYDYKCIYFDNEGRLRKYSWQLRFNDGGHDHINFLAYYDEQGNLIYIRDESGCNCDDYLGYYYVYQGRIVDYYYGWDCYCCEEEDLTEEKMGIIRPKIGDLLEKATLSHQSYKRFITSQLLLDTLRNPDGNQHDEFDDDTE